MSRGRTAPTSCCCGAPNASILVDHAKSRLREKRGGTTTSPLEDLETLDSVPMTAGEIDVLEIDEALGRLAVENSRLAEIVELHYFGGLTYQNFRRP